MVNRLLVRRFRSFQRAVLEFSERPLLGKRVVSDSSALERSISDYPWLLCCVDSQKRL